jgi:hypothetical protein
VAPAGSVWSSVSDMSKWMRFILDSGRVGSKRLIAPATFRELITPQIRAPMTEYPALQLSRPHFFSYGLGWFVQDYDGQMVWMHTGSIDGMSAIIGLMPERRLGVYILENLDHAELRHALMYKAFDLYGSGAKRDWSTEVRQLFASLRPNRPVAAGASTRAAPTMHLERYAGTYVDSAYGTIRVAFADGKLRAQIVNEPEESLEPASFDVFRTRPADPGRSAVALTFVPDGSGNVSAIRLAGVTFSRVATTGRRQ